MSSLGIVFYSVFGMNVFLSMGLVPSRNMRLDGREPALARALLLLASSLIVSLSFHFCWRYLLVPFGLATLEPLAYMAIAITVMSGLSSALSRSKGALAAKLRSALWDVLPSAYLYAIVAFGVRLADGLLQLALSSVCSVAGYYAAVWILDRIMDRLAIVDVPAPFKGRPLRLVTAGLLALAFCGLDQAALSKLAY